MAEQLTMFEPSGPEVLALASKYDKEARKAIQLAQVWSDLGCKAVAGRLLHTALEYDRWAAEMRMLAEFEALGGVS